MKKQLPRRVLLRPGRYVLGLAVSGLFLGIFFYRVNLQEMGRALATAHYVYLVPAVLMYLLSFGWRALRWRTILQPLGHFRLLRLWPVILVGYAANNLLPARLGEVVRAYYLGQREGTSASSALATILVERIFDGLALLFLAATAATVVPVVGLFQDLGKEVHIPGPALMGGISLPFFLVCAALVLLAFRPDLAGRVAPRLVRWLPRRLEVAVVELVMGFVAGFSALRNPRQLLAIFLFSLPLWLFEAVVYFILAFAFGIDAFFDRWSVMAGVLVMTLAISNLGGSIPSSGGGVGPFEFFAQATLVSFGVAAPAAAAYVVIVHATLLLPITALGLVHLWQVNLSLMRLGRESQSQSQVVLSQEPPAAPGGGSG